MHSVNGFGGAGAQIAPAPHEAGAPVGAQAPALVAHVAGGTLGICCELAPPPPMAGDGPTLTRTSAPTAPVHCKGVFSCAQVELIVPLAQGVPLHMAFV